MVKQKIAKIFQPLLMICFVHTGGVQSAPKRDLDLDLQIQNAKNTTFQNSKKVREGIINVLKLERLKFRPPSFIRFLPLDDLSKMRSGIEPICKTPDYMPNGNGLFKNKQLEPICSSGTAQSMPQFASHHKGPYPHPIRFAYTAGSKENEHIQLKVIAKASSYSMSLQPRQPKK